MARFGFCGPSYQSQSITADAQRLINWYLEQIESGQGQSSFALYPCAGLKAFCDLGGPSVRGQIVINGRMFGVSAGALYEIAKDGTKIVRNQGQPLSNDGAKCSIATNPLKMLFASGGQLYLLDLTTNQFNSVDGELSAVSRVAFSDGYFFALDAASQKIQFSALEDPTSWDGLDVIQISEFNDNLLSMLVAHRELWLFGESHAMVYYNSGDANNPWQPVSGAFLESGIAAADSLVLLDNSPFWLGTSERGEIMAYRANGYLGQRISTHALESEWADYPTVSDAYAYAFSDRGHSFYQLAFPSARKGLGATWVYDVATGQWHERAHLNAAGQLEAHRSNGHSFVFGKHLVGDRASGKIYDMSQNYLDNDGAPIKRLRRAPHVATEAMWIYHQFMQLLMESGAQGGNSIPGPGEGDRVITMSDGNGQKLQVSITDGGNLQVTPVGYGATDEVYFRDTQTNQIYEVTLVNDGSGWDFNLTAVSYAPHAFEMLKMVTPSGLQSGWRVDNGNMVTVVPYQAYREPQIILRWSDDGGHTWSNEHARSAGSPGEFRERVYWQRLGRARDRVYEVSCTDPSVWRIVDAYLKTSPGSEPQDRYMRQMAKVM